MPPTRESPTSSDDEPVQRLGIAWFDRDEWRKMREVAVDSANLDDTFEEWEAGATRILGGLQARGVLAEPVHISTSELRQWCVERNLQLDGAARAEFTDFKLRQKYEGA